MTTDVLVKDNFGGDIELLEVNGVEVDQPENKNDDWEGTGAANNVSVLWTGKTLKAHLEWLVASLDDGESASLTVLVSTDINTGDGNGKKDSGHQEYTSEGEHCLNSGPTAQVVINDYELSYTGNEICVTVEPAIE